MALNRIDIVKGTTGWVAKSGGQEIANAGRKSDLVKQVAQTARAGGGGTSVRIHAADGRIQEERTYGRNADPRRSRG